MRCRVHRAVITRSAVTLTESVQPSLTPSFTQPQDQQYIDFQQQQQQQQPQVDPNFVTYQAQPPTQPYDYSTQPQQQADFTNQHAEYQQQQQQVEFQNGSNDYAFDQQYQMQMMGGEMDMNMAMGGMGMMGVKRPRGEKISSKGASPSRSLVCSRIARDPFPLGSHSRFHNFSCSNSGSVFHIPTHAHTYFARACASVCVCGDGD